MKLTQRLFLFFFITLSSTSVSVYLLSNQIFLQGFTDIEDAMAINNLHRITNVIAEEGSALNHSTVRWSSWDETYDFARGKNKNYVRKNLDVASVFESQFQQVHIINSQGEIIFSRNYDLATKSFTSLPDDQMSFIQNKLIPLLRESPDQPLKTGLFVGLDHRAYLLSSSPILNSAAEGPSKGYFVALREIDSGMKSKFSKIIKLDMDISVGNIKEWAEKKSDDVILLKSPNSTQGLIAMEDIFRQHKLVARLEVPRTIYNQGRKTVLSFMVIIGFFLTVTFGFVFFGFHKDVLSKILKLKDNLNTIGSQTNHLPRILWEGRDEIAELTQNINSMLERLENSQVLVNRASKFSALGEMAGSIAHEINNPLAIITGFCTRLIRSTDKEHLSKEEVRETANRILKTSYRIERIIKSLRLVSRDGERDPKMKVALGDILDEVISLSDNKLQESRIELRVEKFNRDQEIKVKFVQFVQVLLNLLTNSIDALSSLDEKWIEFKTEVDERMVHIFVLDSGTGIHQSIAEKVMNPFFTTKELGRGTGLGLSISKGIIESHGGTFQLVKDSANTCFKISIPR